ncbi:MAG: alpha/beta fold hydrolase [Verrucomicrobiota bacterium]
MHLLRRFMLLGLTLILLGFAGAVWWAGNELASPGRRTLHDYHHEFLADPAAHGASVTPFTLKDGTPCLMMEPLANGRLGERGMKVREQLAADPATAPLPPAGKIIGTLVLVHGRKGRKEDYLLIGERLCAAGFRCLLPDMPAHGEHPVTTITFGLRESEIPAQVLAEAANQFHFNTQPCGLLGMSMGGAVSMHAAAREDAPWKTLVIISSFDRLDETIQNNVSQRVGAWLGPVWQWGAGIIYEHQTGIELKDIRSDLPASQLKIPVLMAHGTADKVIPIDAGRRLYAALPAGLEKQWVEIPGADHHNVLITDFPIYATIARWMLNHVSPPATLTP